VLLHANYEIDVDVSWFHRWFQRLETSKVTKAGLELD